MPRSLDLLVRNHSEGLLCGFSWINMNGVRDDNYLRQAFMADIRMSCQELPRDLQRKMTIEFSTELANSLLDYTRFKIVSGLWDLQRFEENNLHKGRCDLVNRMKEERDNLDRSQSLAVSQCEPRSHHLYTVQKIHSKKLSSHEEKWATALKQYDENVILSLDQRVKEQQIQLEKALVPGFMVTNDPTQVQLQMWLLKCILKLGTKHGHISNDTTC